MLLHIRNTRVKREPAHSPVPPHSLPRGYPAENTRRYKIRTALFGVCGAGTPAPRVAIFSSPGAPCVALFARRGDVPPCTAANVTLLCLMPRRTQPLRIAIDTGGTFTDCVWTEAGRLRMMKVFSTPADPSQAIVEALQEIAHEGDVILLHGTTVGTNTLLERKGART